MPTMQVICKQLLHSDWGYTVTSTVGALSVRLMSISAERDSMSEVPDSKRKSKISWRRWLHALTSPDANPELSNALESQRPVVPTLWLLGKTGAGKTSLIQAITGDSRATIGNGFESCTQTASLYEHPIDAPVMRFLDTRGLGEAGYDPTEDLSMAEASTHAILLLTRVDDPNQQEIIDTVQSITKRHKKLPLIHIHTASDMLNASELPRAVDFNRQQMVSAIGRSLPEVVIDFSGAADQTTDALDLLCQQIVSLVPELALSLSPQIANDQEHAIFLDHRREVLGYATLAGAVDAMPAVGLIAVPTLQGKLLHALAGRYGIEWDRRVAREFIAALGTGFLYRYALSFSGRQLMKLIPVWGQSVGAATAASISFASTYALGRVACLYLYRRRAQQSVNPADLQAAFREAFAEPRRPR